MMSSLHGKRVMLPAGKDFKENGKAARVWTREEEDERRY